MRSIVSNILIFLVKTYKRFVSPLLPSVCRFEPTCSVYALECLQEFPPGKAMWLSLRRLLRCHPFHRGGFDPIPRSELEGRS